MNTTYLNKDSMAMSFRMRWHIISSIKSKCDIKMFTNQNKNPFSSLSFIERIIRKYFWLEKTPEEDEMGI